MKNQMLLTKYQLLFSKTMITGSIKYDFSGHLSAADTCLRHVIGI